MAIWDVGYADTDGVHEAASDKDVGALVCGHVEPTNVNIRSNVAYPEADRCVSQYKGEGFCVGCSLTEAFAFNGDSGVADSLEEVGVNECFFRAGIAECLNL